MLTIKFSRAFERTYKKLIKRSPEKSILILEKILIFQNSPFPPSLSTHKLSGSLKDFYSFSVEYNIRIVFTYFSENAVIFEDIGSRDEVY